MRIVVYGAGAVGGLICGRLHQHAEHHGHEILAIARGAHYEAIRETGLTVSDPVATATIRVPVADHPSRIGWEPGDTVILAMKSQHTVDALESLRAAAGPVADSLTIVCAQNGVANERLALRRFPNVVGLCVMLPAWIVAPGHIAATPSPMSGLLDVGRYPTGIDARTETVASALRASTFVSDAHPAIMAAKHRKLLMNLANAIEAAIGPSGRVTDLAKRARTEARACFEAAGIECMSAAEEEARRQFLHLVDVPDLPRGGGSTWQSLDRGAGSVEADYLNGEIVLLGRLHGVATPVNAALQGLANRMAAHGQRPSSMTVAEVEALVMA